MQGEESVIIDSRVKEIHEAKGLGSIEFFLASTGSLGPWCFGQGEMTSFVFREILGFANVETNTE